MSDEDQRLGEMLRAVAARAERDSPLFDPDRIVKAAHRRRPWMAVASWFRAAPVSSAPAYAFATVVVVVAGLLIALTAAHVFSSGHGPFAGPTTTTPLTLPTTTRPPPTSRPSRSSTTVTTLAPTTTTGSTTTTTGLTTTTTSSTTTTTLGPTSTTTFFYTAQWQGGTVNLEPVTNIADMRAVHGKLVGVVTAFLTDDPRFVGLDGDSIDVWRVPGTPGELFVNNSEQSQTDKGTWVFPG